MQYPYAICSCSVTWTQPDAMNYTNPISYHKSLRTAAIAEHKIQRRCIRVNGKGSWKNVKILRHVKPATFEELTTEEWEELADKQYHLWIK